METSLYLIKHGANPSLCNKNSKNILHLLIQFLSKETAISPFQSPFQSPLLSRQTNNNKNLFNSTTKKKSNHSFQMVKKIWLYVYSLEPSLIEKIDSQNNYPLHLSVIHRNYFSLSFLLQNNASPNCLDASHHTPLYHSLFIQPSSLSFKFAKLLLLYRAGNFFQ